MGIFDFLKKSQRDVAKEELVDTPWHVLSSTDQLQTLISESNQKPVAIFKHSTRCGISRMVLRQFESTYDYNDNEVGLYFLDLLAHRDVSNAIAQQLGVQHESPQLIILQNEKVVHHDSHHSINTAVIANYLNA